MGGTGTVTTYDVPFLRAPHPRLAEVQSWNHRAQDSALNMRCESLDQSQHKQWKKGEFVTMMRDGIDSLTKQILVCSGNDLQLADKVRQRVFPIRVIICYKKRCSFTPRQSALSSTPACTIFPDTNLTFLFLKPVSYMCILGKEGKRRKCGHALFKQTFEYINKAASSLVCSIRYSAK